MPYAYLWPPLNLSLPLPPLSLSHTHTHTHTHTQHGFIRHTVNKITFSEQCYYIFGDFRAAANSLPSGSIATITCDEVSPVRSFHQLTALSLSLSQNLATFTSVEILGRTLLGPFRGPICGGRQRGNFHFLHTIFSHVKTTLHPPASPILLLLVRP